MTWQLVGSAQVKANWILVGTITSTLIKFSIQSTNNPYNLSRIGYLRQEFEADLYSANWVKIWPKPGEEHLLELPTLGYASRSLYLQGGFYNLDWVLTVFQFITP